MPTQPANECRLAGDFMLFHFLLTFSPESLRKTRLDSWLNNKSFSFIVQSFVKFCRFLLLLINISPYFGVAMQVGDDGVSATFARRTMGFSNKDE